MIFGPTSSECNVEKQEDRVIKVEKQKASFNKMKMSKETKGRKQKYCS